MKFDNIHIVMLRTFHPGNIGAAARAVKTMGLTHLDLVAPKLYPDEQATQMAAGAADILASSTVYDHLSDCLAQSQLTIATTARPRGYDLPALAPEAAARLLLEHSQHGQVSLLFGPERMGLHNDDLKFAQYRLSIPANPAYSSLNLAAAVQIMSYELFKAGQVMTSHQPEMPDREPNECALPIPNDPLPSSAQFEQLLEELQWVLQRANFLRTHQGETLLRIRQFLRQAQPNQAQMNIMRGAIKKVAQELKKTPS